MLTLRRSPSGAALVLSLILWVLGAGVAASPPAHAYDRQVDGYDVASSNARDVAHPTGESSGLTVSAVSHEAGDVHDSLHYRYATNATEIPEVIYRGGGRSPSNLTLREGEEALSFRSSLSNPYPADSQAVFRPGREYIGIDTSGLPPGSVVVDNVPPGHVSVFLDDVDLLRSLIVEKGRFPK